MRERIQMRGEKLLYPLISMLLTLFFISSSIAQQDAQPPMPDWEILGHYGEACSCDIGCPCIFKVPATQGFCKIALLFAIVKGKYGIIDLSGLRVVVTGEIGKGAFLSYYMDERATPQQREALVNIFRGLLKGLAKEDLGVKSVPIRVQLLPKSRGVSIPGILEFKVEQVVGRDGHSPVVITNPPMHFLLKLIVSRSSIYKYQDHGKSWDYSGKSGFQGDFFFSSLMFK